MFKILSIDGGGIRGIIPAKILAQLELDLRRAGKADRLSDYFDLICGTSTGGIIAIGLALGMSANDILKLYKDNAASIFPQSNWLGSIWKFCKDLPLYRREVLASKLDEAYNKMVTNRPARLGHCLTRVCIPIYDGQKGGMRVLKTPHHKMLTRDYQIPAKDVALSTAAAPVYFDSYDFKYIPTDSESEINEHSKIDGGVVANNPAMIGYIEALSTLGIPENEISILSLGTGTCMYKAEQRKMGSRYWIYDDKHKLRLYDIMSSGQSDYIDSVMLQLQKGIGGIGEERFGYHRIQHCFEPSLVIDLGDSDQKSITRLEDIATKLYYDNSAMLIEKFCADIKEDYKPCKTL